jgi:hypothetical protein
MMRDGVERWQKFAVIIFNLVFIGLFLLNRIPWETDGLRDISFVGFLFVLYIALIIACAQTTSFLFHFLRHSEVRSNFLYLRIKNICRISIAGVDHV